MNRAYSLLTIKSVDDDARVITGIASTPTPDRMGDIVEPAGAQFKLPIPLLYQHNSRQPIGQVTTAKVTKNGIEVTARIAKNLGIPFIDEAWTLIKSGLVRGLSIGFTALESARIKDTFSEHFLQWEWLELSAVTIPANAEANIQTIKMLDQEQRTASGRNDAVFPNSRLKIFLPGVAGTQQMITGSKGPELITLSKETKVNLQESIAGFESKRAASVAAMEAIMAKATEDGATLDDEDSKKYDEMKDEVKRIDDHLVRLREHEAVMVSKAKPITPTAGMQDEESKTRVKAGEGVLRADPKLPPGIGMARYVKALCFAKGNYQQATEYAKQWEASTPEVITALKTAVSAGTTTDSAWAGPLVYAQDFPAAFLDYLRPQTIIGKLTGISRVPFNIRYGIQSAGSTVAWVGQGAPKPVSKLTFTSGSLGFAKAAGIVIITQELARFSSPSAELKVRDDLAAQMVQFLDSQFIDPGVAAVANVSPASILNGASNVRQAAAAWTSMANVLTDVKVLLATFAAQEISLQGGYWVMTPDTAMSLGLLLNTGGTAFAFPDISVNGGNFLGLPVIVSNSVPHSTSAGAIVALVVPQHIYLADDGAVAIDASTEASLQMDDAPTNNSATPTATSLVSMFQTNSIAVRAERIINWSRARNYGVGYIDNMHTS